MKTIEITDEMYNALMVISNELNTQGHRCTAMPYMIQVSKKEEIAAYSGCGDDVIWVGDEGHELRNEEDETEVIRNFLHEKHGGGYDVLFDAMYDYEKESILEDLNYRQIEITTEEKLSNFFFTEKGLRDYYGKDVNTFLTGVTNPELKTVMTFLCELNGGKLHR